MFSCKTVTKFVTNMLFIIARTLELMQSPKDNLVVAMFFFLKSSL